jgi:hypothetical protein
MVTNPQASSINPHGSTSKDSEHKAGTARTTGTGGSSSAAGETFKREGQAASEAMHEATDAVRRKASDLASEAKKGAWQHAESMQGETSEALHVFADAARDAGDRLKKQDHGIAARLVDEAAGGLDHISRSLGQKRLDEVAEDVRAFGRRSPAAFMAASVLAGIALGRFLRSSAPDQPNTGRSDGAMNAGQNRSGQGAAR